MPTLYPPPLSQQDIQDLFVDAPDPAPSTFELALVLGGTVSAGAYTAGALDFLFEALDQWTALRDAGDESAPKHRVQVRVIAGTSGGGVNAAIAARALAWRYPPVSRGLLPQAEAYPPYGTLTGNPFYDVWYSMLRLDRFLDCSDLKGGVAASVLNGTPIDDAAKYISTFRTDNPAIRPYLGEPLRNDPMRLILTMTNLQGIPYRTVFSSAGDPPPLGETFVDHADHARFAVAYWSQKPFSPRPDETVLGFEDPGGGDPLYTAGRWPQAIGWPCFAEFAKATAAFPLGFPSRLLNRPITDYRYRVAVLPADADGKIDVRGLLPDWAQFASAGTLPPSYNFSAVDGGAVDNEPIELARTALCGVKGRNPRDAKAANRGVMLIDPFAGEAALGSTPHDLFAAAGGTLNALLQQTRYDSADITMAADPDIYSRFMISANRAGLVGDKAAATGGVGAFVGFACPAFSRHDYLLGRANCQKMLRESFVVDPENPVVSGQWTATQIEQNRFVDETGKTYLPLIPLLGTAAVPESTEPWPVGALQPNAFDNQIETRWKALLSSEFSGTWWKSLIGWLGGVVTEGAVANYAAQKIRDDLQAWDLLPP